MTIVLIRACDVPVVLGYGDKILEGAFTYDVHKRVGLTLTQALTPRAINLRCGHRMRIPPLWLLGTWVTFLTTTVNIFHWQDPHPHFPGGWACCCPPYLGSALKTSVAVPRPSFASPVEPERGAGKMSILNSRITCREECED